MIAGAVLAGGQASRFGSDKALAHLDGVSLIQRSIDLLKPWCEILVVAGRSHPGLPSVDDWPTPGLGPLGGIAGAMRFATAQGAERLLCIPCDTPIIADKIFSQLVASDAPAFVDACPVIAIWPTSLGGALSRHLETSGGMSLRRWANMVGAHAIASPPIININHPGDLENMPPADH